MGNYPAAYNPKIHGCFDPARYYGKPDIPFGEVQMRQLARWLSRREKSPAAMIAAVSRAWWRWNHKYVQPKRAGIAPFFQLTFLAMIFFYGINYGKIIHHRNYKYH